MTAIVDMTGRRYGRLLVLSRGPNTISNNAAWLCHCDCGVEKVIKGAQIRRGDALSCGCLHREITAANSRTHDEAGKRKTSEYRIWSNMLTRCHNTTNKAFKDYGGRGINVCPRWLRYQSFLEDMGRRPSPLHSIERKDNSRGYYKENCIWATPREQSRNKRSNRIVEFNGEKMPLCDAAELADARYKTVWWRFKNGWPLMEALYGRS